MKLVNPTTNEPYAQTTWTADKGLVLRNPEGKIIPWPEVEVITWDDPYGNPHNTPIDEFKKMAARQHRKAWMDFIGDFR